MLDRRIIEVMVPILLVALASAFQTLPLDWTRACLIEAFQLDNREPQSPQPAKP